MVVNLSGIVGDECFLPRSVNPQRVSVVHGASLFLVGQKRACEARSGTGVHVVQLEPAVNSVGPGARALSLCFISC